MTWIKTISYDNAEGKLKQIYSRVAGPGNNIDNILMCHSLRPHSLQGHMALYKNVLHNSNNTLPKWYLEALGVYVSKLNQCEYCVNHHFEGLKRLIAEDKRAEQIQNALFNNRPEIAFDGAELKGMEYAEQLTLHPTDLTEDIIREMRDEGLSDGEILEINQVVSYFCYANRTVLGLGVNTKGDILGLSPNESDDPDNWSHK